MRRKRRHLHSFQHVGKSQCAAISVPQTIVRMDQDAERRRFQALGLHGPSLERLPGRIRRKIGRGPSPLATGRIIAFDQSSSGSMDILLSGISRRAENAGQIEPPILPSRMTLRAGMQSVSNGPSPSLKDKLPRTKTPWTPSAARSCSKMAGPRLTVAPYIHSAAARLPSG